MDTSRIGLNLAHSHRIAVALLCRRKDCLHSESNMTPVPLSRPAMSIEAQAMKTGSCCSDGALVDSGTTNKSKRPTTPTIQRRRNSSGLLNLKAHAQVEIPKCADDVSKSRAHRSTQSLTIPLPITRTDTKTPQWAQQSATTEVIKGNVGAAFLKHRGVEYLHRNIFLGTTSLNTFLDHLETDIFCACDEALKRNSGFTCRCPITATKSNIIHTFSVLADKEQTFLRSRSQNSEAWELVRCVDPTQNNNDFMSLRRIQLGSVSLGEFLEFIGPEGWEGSVLVNSVVKAFESACRKDGERQRDWSSKAAAYRRWLVLEETEVD